MILGCTSTLFYHVFTIAELLLYFISVQVRAATDSEVQRLLKEGNSLGDLIRHLKNILQADGNSPSTPPSSLEPSTASSSSSPRMSSTLPPRITRSKVSSATATSTSTVVAGGILGQRSASPTGTDVDPVDAVCVLLQLVR